MKPHGKFPCQPPKHVASHSGFTLMELLVVIAIMAILSAILLPTLNKGRSRSQAISCLNNLRQLQLSWEMYTHDNSDGLPGNDYVDGIKIGSATPSTGSSWCPGDARMDTTTDNIQRGELYSYNRSAAIYHCPSDHSKVLVSAGITESPRTRSYSMSSSINAEVTKTVFSPIFRKVSDMSSPTPGNVFVFIDANENSISDGHFAIFSKDHPSYSKFWYDLPSSRHEQAGNLSFADGHIERSPWATQKVFVKRPQQAEISGDATNIRNTDLGDLQKLQEMIRQK